MPIRLKNLTVILVVAMLLIQPAVQASPVLVAGPWYVSPTGNDSNDCASPTAPCLTINAAIGKASPGDTIYVAIGMYGGTGNEVVLLNKDIKLYGGWTGGTLALAGMSTLDGQGVRRGISVNIGVIASVERFNIVNGNGGAAGGGGILNWGNLTVTNSNIDGNVMGDACCTGGEGGGGIYNRSGTLVLNHSTVSNNRIIGGFNGSGIHNLGGVLTLNNSTVTSNFSDGINMFVGTLSLNNSTISYNLGRGINNQAGVINVQNSILANNKNGDCYNDSAYPTGAIHSFGYNIVQGSLSCTWIGSDLTGIDPQLGPLRDNGGPTPTRALLPGSPAIKASNPAGCSDDQGNMILSDQRGAPRARRCDIGAYQVVPLTNKTVQGAFRPGGLVTFTIAFENLPSTDMVSVSLSDTLPVQLTYVPDSLTFPNGVGIASGSDITWTGTVYSSTATTITYATLVTNTALGAVITNTAASSWSGFTETSEASFDTFSRSYLPVVFRDYCPDFFDDFGNPASGWSVGENDHVRSEYTDGEYRVLSKWAGYFYLFRSPSCDRDNYTVEMDVHWAGATGNSYGLLFGITSGFSQYYLFDMNADYQMYRLYRRGASGFTSIVPATVSSAIHPGTQTNHLKVTRSGSQITLEVNGTVLGSWTDSVIMGKTGVGLVSSPYNDIPVSDARFDNFAVKNPSSGVAAGDASSVATCEASTGSAEAIDRQPPEDLGW